MSQLIVCRECGTENVSGSKFCNNCGSKLPPATHIICPSCEAVNPINRVFCDNCGTRLVSNDLQDEESPPSAPPPAAKAFTLPSRRPGDTGTLDPGSLPDWLRTGKTDQTGEGGDEAEEPESEQEQPERMETGRLPRVEELTPEKRTTDDLPDWLISESDSDPIIDSPEGISTEMFLDLVSRAEEKAEDEDVPLDTSGAALPDWLAEAGNLPDRHTAGAKEDDFEAPFWLDPDAEEELVDEDESLPPDPELADFSVTAWLSDPDAVEADDGTQDDADFSGHTDWLADLDADEDALPEIEEEDAELSDWLMQLNQLAQADEPAAGLDLPDGERAETAVAGEDEAWLADEDDDWLATLAASGPQEDDDLADEIARTFSAGEPEEVASEFADLFQSEGGDTGELPDWLADVAAEGDTLVADEDLEDTDLDDLFAKEEMAAQSELDWLMQTGGLKLPEEEEADETPPADKPASGDAGGLDWLSELASLDTNTLRAQDADDALEETGARPADEQEALDLQPETAVSQPADEETLSEPWGEADSSLAPDEELPEELPDWLSELGPAGSTQQPEGVDEAESVPSQQLPDWLAELRPDESVRDIESSLPDPLTGSEAKSPGELEDVPAELAGGDLPDWLGSSDAVSLPEALLDEDEDSLELPDWLRQDEEAKEASLAGSAPVDEWSDLLDELPPPARADELAQADIPDWLRDMKPGELAGGAQVPLMPAVREGPAEEEGPLAGLRGVIQASPVVTAVSQLDLTPFTATPAQRQQSALLRQLTQSGQPSERVTGATLQPAAPVWVRILLAALLLAALLAGLLLPQLSGLTTAATDVTAAYEAVEAAAGRPVLMAFEYTPAMSGELTPAAQTLVAQLVANGSSIVTLSQYAAGVTLAETTAPLPAGRSLGYLPGEAIGLRALGDCLDNQRLTCMGVPNWSAHQTLLADVALIVVLAGERDSLQNWIEQVQSQVGAPMLVVVPQSLEPVAAPYLSSGQLAAVLAGAPATAVYQMAVLQQTDGGAPDGPARIVTAQTLAQLVAIFLLLTGMIVYGLFSAGQKPSQAE